MHCSIRCSRLCGPDKFAYGKFKPKCHDVFLGHSLIVFRRPQLIAAKSRSGDSAAGSHYNPKARNNLHEGSWQLKCCKQQQERVVCPAEEQEKSAAPFIGSS